jgi:putative transposase
MVRYRRNFVPGGTYFFTVTLADRRSSALVEHVDLLRAAFRKARRLRPYSIDAIVVLPEHLHVVMTLPPDDADFSARWKLIKAAFTTRLAAFGVNISPNSKGEYPLWQRRFWEHTVRDGADFERHVNYIHFNPVKHGFVAAVNEWPHSSFHYYVRRGVLPKDWGGSAGSSNGGFGERKG